MDVPEATQSPRPLVRRLPSIRFAVPARFRRGLSDVPEWLRGLALFAGLLIFVAVYVTVLGALAGEHSGSAPSTADVRSVDDAAASPDSFRFAGGWERVVGQHDGRTDGTSTRSFRIGASATLSFVGSSVRVYGVTGPSGGTAAVTIDGRASGIANFYSRSKHTGVLVFSSPSLAEGSHKLALLVEPPPDGTKTKGYVNIDTAAYSP